MAIKKILFREDAREPIRKGIDTLTDAVKIARGRMLIQRKRRHERRLVRSY